MAQCKAHEVDAFVRRPDRRYRALLVYGPDRGLVSERANALVDSLGMDPDDPFNVVRLEAADLGRDPGRLFDEIGAIALFGGERLVRVRGAAGAERPVVAALEAVATDPPTGVVLLVEASELKKGAALRKAAETGKGAMALPCYGDDRRAIDALIGEELGKAGLTLTPAARRRLAGNLGGDRLASRGELQKLALYGQGMGQLDEKDVLAVIGDAAALSIEEAVDCALAGDPAGLDRALARITASKTSAFAVIQVCLRQFQVIDALRGEIEHAGKSLAEVTRVHGRRMHFRRKPAFETALRTFDGVLTGRAMRLLNAAVLDMRRRPALETAIAARTLLAIAARTPELFEPAE